MQLHALTGQLHIVNGVEQESPDVPGLLSMPSPSKAAHGRQNEVLFVHLTISGPADQAADLMRTELLRISDLYFNSVGSVTAALRRVIQETNNWLLKLNLEGSIDREGAITCAVQRNNELYIVQVGESLALIGRNFGVERMPARQPDHMTPLGQSAGIDFRYYHQRLHPGDMLLLADPRISHLPSHALAPALVDTELELGLEELRAAVDTATGRLLLVEFTDEPLGLAAATVKPPRQRGRISLPFGLGARAAQDNVTIPAQPVRSTGGGKEKLEDDDYTAEYGDSYHGDYYEDDAYAYEDLSETVEITARQAASSSAAGLSRATGWTAAAMGRIRPAQEEGPDGPHWAIPTLLAIVIPILVALVVSSVYMQRGRVQQVAQIRQEMSDNLAAAQEAAGDPEIARDHYERILALATEAEELRPGDAGVAEIRRMSLVALDELDGVTRLSAKAFHTFGEATDLKSVAIRDDFTGGVFVLDETNNVVYNLDTDETYQEVLSEQPETLSFEGQAIGTHVVQDLVDIMWRPSGVEVERDGLAILDSAGALLTYYPNAEEIRSTPLGLSSEWQNPYAIAQFSERLYILDPAAEVIWKYFPQADGFVVDEGERTLFLSDGDLQTASDFDIYSEDGSMLLTYPDGRVRYIDTATGQVQWDENDLLKSGLAEPLEMPVAGKFIGRGLNASAFILDAGSGRIIQVSRLGNVLAQYRALDSRGQDIFRGASDLSVAETPLRILVTNGNQLFVAEQ
jgi:hypothetical protein